MAKTVFEASMVCHLWANRHPHDIRTQSGNLSTRGAELWSYGAHYVVGAHLDTPVQGPSLIIISDYVASRTTSRHTRESVQALTPAQRATVVRVPVQITGGDTRNPDTLRRIARDTVASAIAPLSKCATARGSLTSHVATARQYLDAARAILTYVGDVKAARTLPMLTADADKAAAAAALRAIARDQLLTSARNNLGMAESHIWRAESDQTNRDRDGISYRKTATAVMQAKSFAARAIDDFKAAGVRAPSRARAIVTRADEIAEAIAEQVLTETDAETLSFVRGAARELAHELAEYRRRYAAHPKLERRRADDKAARSVIWKWSRLHDAAGVNFWADESTRARIVTDGAELAQIVHDHNRAQRINDCACILNAMTTLRAEIDYVRNPDGRPQYLQPRLSMASLRQMVSAPHIPAYFRARADLLSADAEAARAEAEAIRATTATRKVAAWRAGAEVGLPGGLPDMARIVGDTVQTSRGATVPLMHAIRLVRLVRATVARGGAVWGHGTGPYVGHFRVVSISADSRVVIGCHDFSPDETAHFFALVESLEAVAS